MQFTWCAVHHDSEHDVEALELVLYVHGFDGYKPRILEMISFDKRQSPEDESGRDHGCAWTAGAVNNA